MAENRQKEQPGQHHEDRIISYHWPEGRWKYTAEEILKATEDLKQDIDWAANVEPHKGSGESRYKYITERQIVEFEERYPEGMTADQIVDICRNAGMRFSKATLRSYVSKELLAGSVRRKIKVSGKRYSSQGVYPPSTVRQIARIKHLLEEEEYTIEEVAGAEVMKVNRIAGLLGKGYRELVEKRDSLVRRVDRGNVKVFQFVDRYEHMIRVLDGMFLTLNALEEDEAIEMLE